MVSEPHLQLNWPGTARHISISADSARNAEKVTSTIRDSDSNSKVTFIQGDLVSLASVKSAAEQFLSQRPRLDLLMCNAEIIACPPGLTQDGYKIFLGTNHLGHALLIKQ